MAFTPRKGYEARRITHFDEQYDEFWKTIEHEFPCAVVRDASFLNWKFAHQPGQEIHTFELRRHGKIVAVASFVMRAPDAAYDYRRALLLDLLAHPLDQPAVFAMLDAIRRAAYEEQAAVLVFDVTCPKLEQSIRRYGFLQRESTRVFLVATGDLPPSQQALLQNGENWLLTRADSDIDRPESNQVGAGQTAQDP
jgi:hypothetical protein